MHFPDTDERWRDADSIELLRAAVALVRDAGLRDRQRRRDGGAGGAEARRRPSRRCASGSRRRSGSSPVRVNVKATTGEGIGFVGRGEGAAALAIATLDG